MAPAYNSQALSNSPLEVLAIGNPSAGDFYVNETPASGSASIAKAVQAKTVSSGPSSVSIMFECPAGVGAGVFQIQDTDFLDVAGANFNSINFGGATPGQITLANFNASGVCRVELSPFVGRFIRILCVTAPSNPISVRGRQL